MIINLRVINLRYHDIVTNRDEAILLRRISKNGHSCGDEIALGFDEGSTSPRIPCRQETSFLPSAKTSRKFRSPFDDAKVTRVRDMRGEESSTRARALARDMGGRVRI